MNLISPFPETAWDQAWSWLNEVPERNFDDYGPKTEEAFFEFVAGRSNELTWGVEQDGKLCGLIAFLPLSPRMGTFHGICFTKSVWGSGIAKEAVEAVIARLFASGIEKIAASFFAKNKRVGKFLLNLGFENEGYLRAHTLQNGRPIDMRIMAKFRPDDI